LQTQEALKLIHQIPVASGEAMVFNGVANQFYRTAFQRREDCLSHETYPDPIDIPLSADRHTAAQLFAAARERTGVEGSLSLLLDRDLVVSIDCEPCRTSRRIMRPLPTVGQDMAICPHCGHLAKPQLEHVVDEGSPLANERLSALGVPLYDIARVQTAEGEMVYLLAADRQAVMGGSEGQARKDKEE